MSFYKFLPQLYWLREERGLSIGRCERSLFIITNVYFIKRLLFKTYFWKMSTRKLKLFYFFALSSSRVSWASSRTEPSSSLRAFLINSMAASPPTSPRASTALSRTQGSRSLSARERGSATLLSPISNRESIALNRTSSLASLASAFAMVSIAFLSLLSPKATIASSLLPASSFSRASFTRASKGGFSFLALPFFAVGWTGFWGCFLGGASLVFVNISLDLLALMMDSFPSFISFGA